jgi:hypothetical protein
MMEWGRIKGSCDLTVALQKLEARRSSPPPSKIFCPSLILPHSVRSHDLILSQWLLMPCLWGIFNNKRLTSWLSYNLVRRLLLKMPHKQGINNHWDKIRSCDLTVALQKLEARRSSPPPSKATECDFIQHEVDKMLYARHGYIAFLNRRLAVKMLFLTPETHVMSHCGFQTSPKLCEKGSLVWGICW